jgi:hypothetical protein
MHLFHAIQFKVTKGFVTMNDPEDKPRMLTFREKEVAEKYVNYLARFRQTHGQFPVLDLTKRNILIRSNKKKKSLSEETIRRHINIVDLYESDLDSIALKSGMSFFYVHTFMYSPSSSLESVSVRGQNIDGTEDTELLRQHLEMRLKIK